MATQTLQSYDKFLKEWYFSSWIDQLNSMTTTWKLLRRKITTVGGRQLVFPIRTTRNTGVGAVPGSSGGAVPTNVVAGYQGVNNATVTPKIVQGAIQIAQDAIDRSANDRGAFYEVVDFEMMGIVQDLAEDLDRQCHGDGSGTLANTTAVPVGATIAVDYHRPFFEGMIVDGWDSSASGAAARDADLVISSVARNTDGSGVLTFTGAPATLTDNDVLVRKDARTATAGYEFMGLNGIVSATNPPLESTFEGITRTGNAYWQSIVNASTAAPSEALIQSAVDQVHDDSNGDINALLTNRRTRFALYNSLASSNPTRFVDTNVIQPGILSGKVEDHHPDAHDYLFWDGRVPIIVDKYCPINVDVGAGTQRGVLYGLDLSAIYVALVTDFRWWTPQGYILRPSESRSFSVEGLIYIMGNIVTDAPRKHFKFSSLDIS